MCNIEPWKGRRCSSKTFQHLEVYVEYVNLYDVLKLKWNKQRQYTNEVGHIWNDMTKKLNECGGPVRDVLHWKKVFTEWKSLIRRKLKDCKPLNCLEQKLVDLLGLTSMQEGKRGRPRNISNTKENSHDNFEKLNTEVKLEVKDVDEETCTVINLKRSENESRTTLKSRQTESTGMLSKPTTADFSSQVDDGNLLETSTSIGVGLHKLANAINRYCDMVERNF